MLWGLRQKLIVVMLWRLRQKLIVVTELITCQVLVSLPIMIDDILRSFICLYDINGLQCLMFHVLGALCT